jgi:hypothetical protein
MMNKQELIDKLKRHLTVMSEVEGSEYDKGYKHATKQHLALIAELDEPEKPVVPQFVADFYESIKDDFEDKLYELCLQFNNDSDDLPGEIWWWFDCGKNEPIQTLVKMKIYGYEVEKEKRYTVEIPNPNGDGYSKTFLGKFKDDKVELCKWSCYTSIEFADNWKQEEYAQLTESEIKQDFDWAWQFAEEVIK